MGSKIGIVGFGAVGKTIAETFKVDDLMIYDSRARVRDEAYRAGYQTTFSLRDLLSCEAVFVCVTTPKTIRGHGELVLLATALYGLRDVPLVISKSTASERFYAGYGPNVVYSPNFIRAAHAKADYRSTERLIYGLVDPTDQSIQQKIEDVHAKMLVTFKTDYVNRDTAIFAKYAHNLFLTAKVAVANELYEIAKVRGIKWDAVVDCLHGTRVGDSHLNVPGPDGKRGVSGNYLPKDLIAFCYDVKLTSAEVNKFFPLYVISAMKYWLDPDSTGE